MMIVIAGVACGPFSVVARADIDPNSGIDLVRIGAVGNAPWMGNGTSGDTAIGRGSVGYVYNMGRMEVTTAQWCEFFNAVYDRATPLTIPFIHAPAAWGATSAAPTNPGGARWSVPAGNELIPVGGISWRTAAIYCNWLENNKSTDPSAFRNGAYDVSTFQDLPNGFGDQVTHNVNARYWIPTWDEYIKASHYDPNRFGPGQAGYWTGNTTLSHAAIAGPPGTGEANYGFTTPSPFGIPLGAYANVQSAWGLHDTAGATSEWTEGVLSDFGVNLWRRVEGSFWASNPNDLLRDTIYNSADNVPSAREYSYGFRIASSVPTPANGVLVAGVLSMSMAHRKRRRLRACILFSLLDHDSDWNLCR